MNGKLTLCINDIAMQSIYGTEIQVDTKNNVIVNQYWRNRLRDSVVDNCVSVKKQPLLGDAEPAKKANKGQGKK